MSQRPTLIGVHLTGKLGSVQSRVQLRFLLEVSVFAACPSSSARFCLHELPGANMFS
jgi:hypothetical protein